MPPKLALAVAGSRGGRRGGGRGAGRGGVKVGAGPGRAADATAVEQKREASSSEKDEHKCVMCEAVLGSRPELQQHFRLHANGTIDMKGRVTRVAPPARSSPGPGPAPRQSAGQPPPWYGCDVCQESFETVTLAIQHKFRKHPNSNKKYYCGFCGKQYPLEICKTNHIKTDHAAEVRGKNIYKCKDCSCSAEFFTLDAIKYHIRSSHQRVTALINPTATFPASKKIKMNISGEASSVFYCHLCGQEYMVKFNLQKHLEASHTAEERNGPAEQLIKCKLCEAMFYNKKAWDSHNLLHSPADLYINSEADRKLAVVRVDQDFDQSRVPTLLDKLLPVSRPRQITPDPDPQQDPGVQGPAARPTPGGERLAAGPGQAPEPGGRNRAVVNSDSENDKSDTSIESEEELEQTKPPKKKKRIKKYKDSQA